MASAAYWIGAAAHDRRVASVAVRAQQQTSLIVHAQREVLTLFEVTDRAPDVIERHLTRWQATGVLSVGDSCQDRAQ